MKKVIFATAIILVASLGFANSMKICKQWEHAAEQIMTARQNNMKMSKSSEKFEDVRHIGRFAADY